MWFFEALGLVVLAGIMLGVVWRFAEDWFEKRADRRRQAFEAELNKDESSPVVNTVSAPDPKAN